MPTEGTTCFLALTALWIVCLQVVDITACRIDFFKPCPAGMKDDGISCWKHTYGRGVGRRPDKARCPPGLRDDGTSCWNDAHIYGKGCCCTLWGCCHGKCRSGYHDDGCTCRKTNVGIKLTLHNRLRCRANEDLYGSLCYPKCKSGYHPVGCCLCEPTGGPGIKLTLFQRFGVSTDCDFDSLIFLLSKKIGRLLTSFEKAAVKNWQQHHQG